MPVQIPNLNAADARVADLVFEFVQFLLNDDANLTPAGNLTGTPAISIPGGLSHQGLPIGLQLQANYFEEARLLEVAHRFQQATDWHRRAPAFAT